MAESPQIFTVTKDPELLSNFEFADNVFRFLKPSQFQVSLLGPDGISNNF